MRLNNKEIADRFLSLFGDISQKDLAALLRITQPSISDWRSGKKRVPWNRLIDASVKYNVTMDKLLFGEGSTAISPSDTIRLREPLQNEESEQSKEGKAIAEGSESLVKYLQGENTRLQGENARFQAEVLRLTDENGRLRGRLEGIVEKRTGDIRRSGSA
jgi:transcriptional regulator with XRE-family HTH domain